MLDKLIKYLKYYLGRWFGDQIEETYIPEVPQPPVIHYPYKPRIELAIDTSRKWEGIVWHHSASPDHPDINDWEGIKKYHMSWRVDGRIVTQKVWDERLALKKGRLFQRPWKAVGYQGGVEIVSTDKIVFQWGRPLYMSGAHSYVHPVGGDFNKTHIGLCAIGNFNKRAPHPKLWEFCLSLTRTFMDAFDIPAENVIGHREVFPALNVPVQKECPGKFWDVKKFREQL